MKALRPAALTDTGGGGYRHSDVLRWTGDSGQRLAGRDALAEECAVALVYNGISHVVMMATPQHLPDLGLGFTLSEGIARNSGEVYGIEENIGPQGCELNIQISAERMGALKQRRRNLAGRSGCGLCGTESLQQALRPVVPVKPRFAPADTVVQRALHQLAGRQPLQALTGACHGAAWCDAAGDIGLVREDVGRHNALDKLIGALAAGGTDFGTGFALISSRASYEMVQKASSAGIGTLVAVSAATALAVELAQLCGLNLIGFARPQRHIIYTEGNTDPGSIDKPSR